MEKVKKVTVRIEGGQPFRDKVLAITAEHWNSEFSLRAQGDDEIICEPKPGEELFFSYDGGLVGMVPVFRVGQNGKLRGITGYVEGFGQIVADVIETVHVQNPPRAKPTTA